MPDQYDVIVVGGGIVGCMTARALSRYQLKILLIEKEADIGMGVSSANSAIVHAGYDPVPGTLKACMNVAGNKLWDTVSGELNIPYERRGDFVVAIGPAEVPYLDKLLLQGKQNGVLGMWVISGEEMQRREPNINPQVSGALWASTGGICDQFAATIAAGESAVQNGATVMLETEFEDFVFEHAAGGERRVVGVKTNRGVFGCRWVVNAAGLYSDVVMHKAGVRPDFRITPRRGEYSILDQAEITINNVLFPVPTATSKGTLVTTTLHGNTLVGPDAIDIEDKGDTAVTPAGQATIWQGGRRLIPNLSSRHVIAVFAGLRPAGNARCETSGVDYDHDFVIEIPRDVRGFVNLGGIESPGLTSAPAIAERVVDLMKDAGEALVEKRDFDPVRRARPRFKYLPPAEKALLIRNDARYGRVVCRCEMVTEGEIVAAINAPIPARTYDAIKRRTWLGTGRCLGGFDMPRVVALLARELNIPVTEVTKRGKGSEFIIRSTKEL